MSGGGIRRNWTSKKKQKKNGLLIDSILKEVGNLTETVDKELKSFCHTLWTLNSRGKKRADNLRVANLLGERKGKKKKSCTVKFWYYDITPFFVCFVCLCLRAFSRFGKVWLGGRDQPVANKTIGVSVTESLRLVGKDKDRNQKDKQRKKSLFDAQNHKKFFLFCAIGSFPVGFFLFLSPFPSPVALVIINCR